MRVARAAYKEGAAVNQVGRAACSQGGADASSVSKRHERGSKLLLGVIQQLHFDDSAKRLK